MPVAELNMAEVEAFGGKMMGFLNGASAALMLSVGHRVGLFDVMAELPASTSVEIAAAASLDERYVREWLGAMVTAGVVAYDSGSGAFSLPPEHAAFTCRSAGPNNFALFMQFIPLLGDVENQIVDKFRHGGGVPYSEYPRFHETMAEMSRATVDATLLESTLRLIPDVVEQLRRGIDVADIGTGSGHAVNVMAQAFPNSRFVGYDFSDEAVKRAQAEAADMGLANAAFEVQDVAKLDQPGRFDFMTTFDAIHDQAKPRDVVEAIHRALKPGGTWLCVDVQASSHIGENLAHPIGPFLYTVSCMHCMTVSLAYEGEGLGAVWGVHQARQIFADAGFGSVQTHTVPGDIINNYYVCRKF